MYPSVVGVVMLGLFTVVSLKHSEHDISSTSTPTKPPGCKEPGWFGAKCQFRCHCADAKFGCDDVTGQCKGKCARGWFGAACQYAVSPINILPRVPYWLRDDDYNSTCNDEDATSIDFTLRWPHPFTWLRGTTRNSEARQPPQLVLWQPDHSYAVKCQESSVVDLKAQTFDIYCPTTVSVSRILLYGDIISSLCSVRVSAGRNMALRQHTRLSSKSHKPALWPSYRTVDGNVPSTRDRAANRKACSASAVGPPGTMTFIVNFTVPVAVGRVVLHGRTDIQARGLLRGFQLRAYSISSNLYTHTDMTTALDAHDYTITPIYAISQPVHSMQISNSPLSKALSICELEVFGDAMCPKGMWGRECEKTCHCANPRDACQVVTGYCGSGCKEGYTGTDCQRITAEGSRSDHHRNTTPLVGSIMGFTIFFVTFLAVLMVITLGHQQHQISKQQEQQQQQALSEPNSSTKTVDWQAQIHRVFSYDDVDRAPTPSSIQHFVTTYMSREPSRTQSTATSIHSLTGRGLSKISDVSSPESSVDPVRRDTIAAELRRSSGFDF